MGINALNKAEKMLFTCVGDLCLGADSLSDMRRCCFCKAFYLARMDENGLRVKPSFRYIKDACWDIFL
jgi:hypothetical protein